jgi:hypothetical protein
MGANAQTTVPTFTAGQVLTAAQMNNSARTGVPVFADTSARDAGFGGAGEKTLAEGQLCYLEDANVVQYYDGSSWATVGPAAASGLVPITSVSFTTSSAVAFATGVFTSTYQFYRVLFEFSCSANMTLACQVNASGAARTAANYFGFRYDIRADVAVTNIAATSHTIMGGNQATPSHNTFGIDVMNPTSTTKKTTWHGTWYGANAATTFDGGPTTSIYNVAEANDGLTLTPSTGTITGSYKVYGYN